jgi:hypothetical protein
LAATGYRFSAVRLALGAAVCVAMACGGAATTALDRPLPTQPGDDGSARGTPEASTSSSSGGGNDATLAEDSTPGDNGSDAAEDGSGDDVESPPDDAGPPDAGGMCGVCTFGNTCCMMPGAFSFGRCYAVLCNACCL